MAQVQSRAYEPLTGQKFNATTSVINLGTAPQAVIAQTCLALIYPVGSGENGFGWVWARADASNNGQRLVVDHNSGTPRLQCVGSCSGSAGNPTQVSPANSVVYNKWNHVGFWWDGTLATVNAISAFSATNGAPLASLTGSFTSGSGSATNSGANALLVGNGANNDRTFNGTIAYVARWNRVIRQAELLTAQRCGPLAVPNGLIMCWANNRDYGPYRLKATSKTAIALGASPPGRGLLVPNRRLLAGATAGGGAAASVNRWFLMQ
jgi:Concanavalin A-like lectin/glucanases superfamily